MTRNVTPENDYDSLRADGTRDTRGISRMWNVKGHEAARLPMIYAAAWDVTGNRLDCERVSSNGIFYLQAAYWKSRRQADAAKGGQGDHESIH